MSPKTRALALIAGVVLAAGCAAAQALPTSAYRPFAGPWRPVAVPEATAVPSEAPEPSYAVVARPGPTRPPLPVPARKPPTKVAPRQPSRGSHSIAGVASWYCRAGRSVCPVGWGPGFMGAAACAPLRAAMGRHWRGRTVTVSANGRLISVKLVDYCASTSNTIDLFWMPMSALGGTGVLSVTVRW